MSDLDRRLYRMSVARTVMAGIRTIAALAVALFIAF